VKEQEKSIALVVKLILFLWLCQDFLNVVFVRMEKLIVGFVTAQE